MKKKMNAGKIEKLIGESRKKISNLEQQKETLISANRELVKSNNFKSEFLSNMSHELRTPLNSILILAKLLAENETGNLTKEQQESAEIIHNAGSSLLSLINDILDISKIESGKMEVDIASLDLTCFASEIKKSFRPIAKERKVAFTVELAGDIPEHISTDERKLSQIVKNLTSNALKFTDTGTVSIRIHRPEASVEVSNTRLCLKNSIAISVSDTGMGIPRDKQKIIFEAFRQADPSVSRKYGGTGLGLSISGKLARYLGGEIQVKSEPGSGSTFTIYLPETLVWDTPESEQMQRTEPAGENLDLSTKESYPIFDKNFIPKATEYVTDDRRDILPGDKILLIIESDHGFTRKLINTARVRGFKCLVAENGQTGLQFSYEYKPAAIILSDRLMGMRCEEVLDKLKDDLQTRHIPVCSMTDRSAFTETLTRGSCVCIQEKATKKQINQALTICENITDKNVRRVLLAGNDAGLKRYVETCLKSNCIKISVSEYGTDGLKSEFQQGFDLQIIDAGLPGIMISGLLENVFRQPGPATGHILLFSQRDLTEKERAAVKKCEGRYIIKYLKSRDALLDEALLILHVKQNDLTEMQEEILKRLHKTGVALNEKHILIADDDMRNTFALAKMLRKNGMEVYIAENGKKALDILNEQKRVDLLLLDMMMPVMDGYEALKKIRAEKKFNTLPILAVTAKAMKGDRIKCTDAGANDYIAKPIDKNRLLSMLKVWLNR